jgi:hypothetical protein
MTFKFQTTNSSRLQIISKIDYRPEDYFILRNICAISAIDALGIVYNPNRSKRIKISI